MGQDETLLLGCLCNINEQLSELRFITTYKLVTRFQEVLSISQIGVFRNQRNRKHYKRRFLK